MQNSIHQTHIRILSIAEISHFQIIFAQQSQSAVL